MTKLLYHPPMQPSNDLVKQNTITQFILKSSTPPLGKRPICKHLHFYQHKILSLDCSGPQDLCILFPVVNVYDNLKHLTFFSIFQFPHNIFLFTFTLILLYCNAAGSGGWKIKKVLNKEMWKATVIAQITFSYILYKKYIRKKIYWTSYVNCFFFTCSFQAPP